MWNTFSNVTSMVIEFVIGVILARLLSPKEFGLLAMIAILIAISQVLINSGFSQALIRKPKCDENDFSTAFIFNLLTAISCYVIIFFAAPFISYFYNEPSLVLISRVLALVLVISSMAMVHKTKLSINLDFEKLSRINIISTIVSGIIAVILAYCGFGIWSLVYKVLIKELVFLVLIWVNYEWRPKMIFNTSSFKYLFSFGRNLLVGSLSVVFFDNLYNTVIGKYFSADSLGFFNRADMFRRLPSDNLLGIVTAILLPSLSKIQDDPIKLGLAFKKMINMVIYLVSILMVGMIVIAEPMVMTLIGEKWSSTIELLKPLCWLGILIPAASMNLNILIVVGRSDTFLKLQLLAHLFKIPVVIIGIFLGIKAMIYAMIVSSIISYIIYAGQTLEYTNYPIKNQLLDFGKSLLLSLSMALCIFVFIQNVHIAYLYQLIIAIIFGVFYIVLVSEIIKNEYYLEIKQLVFNRVKI